ncbi:MFS transporter [Roseovarius sp. D22-M7]|uniref:MFS transporter n=1 Tax=Roseovarius sp. D22-M7 TaxID=3127116 RepID=UPI0030104D6B
MAIVGPIAANVAFVIEITLVPLLLPAIQQQFGLTIGDLGWVFNSYGLAVAIGVLFGGWWGDAFHTNKVFGLGVALFAIGSLLVAAADSFDALIMARILQGLGAGIFSPLVPLLLTRASPRKPGRMLIVWGSVAGYVAAFAPVLYGSILSEYSWTLAFILNAIIATIALVILTGSTIAARPRNRPAAKRNYSELFRARDLWVAFLYVFCTYGTITYYLFRLPIWLSNNAVGEAGIGLVLSVVWLAFSILSALLRNLVDKPHVRTIMLAAPLLILVALPALFYSWGLLPVLLSAVLIGAGLACSNAPSTQMILRFAPKGLSAVSTSLDITFARFGGIATVATLAATRPSHAAAALSILCLVAACCALAAGRRLTATG